MRSLIQKHLIQNQMFAVGRPPVGGRDRRSSRSTSVGTSTTTDDHGTSSDVNPRIRPVHGQIAGSGGGLLVTTDHMAGRRVPLAEKCARRGAERKGAFGVAPRWRKRHPCPRHHDEHSGQDKGTGQVQGQQGRTQGNLGSCPHVLVHTVTHGETPATAGRISLTVHVNTSLPTSSYRRTFARRHSHLI